LHKVSGPTRVGPLQAGPEGDGCGESYGGEENADATVMALGDPARVLAAANLTKSQLHAFFLLMSVYNLIEDGSETQLHCGGVDGAG
jgi:hypothetical protein